MGSRRRRYATLAILASCTAGAPAGFSGGDRWTIPLVGPLEDGRLLVPALVNGKGPFVFAIDPDARISVVDEQVVAGAELRTGSVNASGDETFALDEAGVRRALTFAQVSEWQLGTLNVHGSWPAEVVPRGTYDGDGRRIYGLIGRDIIAESLAFGFDRDLGVVTLMTTKSFEREDLSSGWASLKFDDLVSHVDSVEMVPPPRRVVEATIGDSTFTLHVDLGVTASQLRRELWAKAKLVPMETHGVAVDEVGTSRVIGNGAVAETVHVGNRNGAWGGKDQRGGWTTPHVAFVAYVDKRWTTRDLDGTLGLGFFKPFKVFADWHTTAIYVTPREDTASTTTARIGRWQSKTLTSCPHLGCVEVKLVDPLAGKPPGEIPLKHPGVIVSVTRDPGAAIDLEVLVSTQPRDQGPPLQWLVANLPAGVDRAMTHLPADYVGATLAVVDASPFPRACRGGCVDLLAAP